MLGAANQVCGQNVPFFETTIYVRDTMGNIDSVQIGHDPNDIPNDTAQFHEIISSGPFDTILDVRVISAGLGLSLPLGGTGGDVLYKRYIAKSNVHSWCTNGVSCVLWISARHKPVTIYWNRSEFANSDICRENAYFSPNLLYWNADPVSIINFGGTVFECASKADSLVWGLPTDWMISNDGVLNITCERELEGGFIDTIAGVLLMFPFDPYFSPCPLVNSEEPAVVYPNSLKIWPNPGQSLLNIQNDRQHPIKRLQLLDIPGRTIWENSETLDTGGVLSHSLDGLMPGLYWFMATWADGSVGVRKWIVAE
jgi:hypothetical protein